MQAQLAEINTDLDQLSAKIEKASDTAKAEAKPKLQALREQTSKLTKQLDTAKDATESTWNDVKAGFKKGWGELKEGFQQARQWVSDFTYHGLMDALQTNIVPTSSMLESDTFYSEQSREDRFGDTSSNADKVLARMNWDLRLVGDGIDLGSQPLKGIGATIP